MFRTVLAATLLCVCALSQAAPVTEVIVVGTYHFSNPGKDQHNIAAVDVMTPERQGQLAAITEALARFKPTKVAVEWPAELTAERYAKYRDDTLPPSPNEVVQLGFRLAKTMKLDTVAGIDVEGDFPYEGVAAFAEKSGRAATLEAMHAEVAQRVAAVEAAQKSGTIAAALRLMNSPESVQRDHALYMAFLPYGRGDEQPGAALASAWYARNLGICARLVQQLKPGDRAVVFYGAGHAYLLKRCVTEMPGYRLVEANDYLPR
jgi:hypothetical protein